MLRGPQLRDLLIGFIAMLSFHPLCQKMTYLILKKLQNFDIYISCLKTKMLFLCSWIMTTLNSYNRSQQKSFNLTLLDACKNVRMFSISQICCHFHICHFTWFKVTAKNYGYFMDFFINIQTHNHCEHCSKCFLVEKKGVIHLPD